MVLLVGQKCPNCGAPIEEPRAFSTARYTCSYCGTSFDILGRPTPKPDLREDRCDRRIQNAASKSPTAYEVRYMIFVVVAVSLLIVLLFGAAAMRRRTSNQTPEAARIPQPAPALPVPNPTPQREPVVADPNGFHAVTKWVSHLLERGCKRILLPPSSVTGTQAVETKFDVKKGCIQILVSTGDRGAPVRLLLRTPSNERIETPGSSYSLNFRFCPSKNGSHPMKIEAQEDDAYTVAAVECQKKLD